MRKVLEAVRRVLPAPVRKQVYRAGKFVGREFAEPFPSMVATFRYLRAWGFDPRTIVDVGAYRGDWTCMAKSIFPTARVLMIEPQDGKRPALDEVCAQFAPDVILRSALLGSADGERVDFFEMETGSSVFEEHSSHPRKTVTKLTERLDSVIGTAGDEWKRIDLLKLDVQGYELEVLHGGSASLSTCEFVLMEVSLVPVNRNAPVMAEVIGFMDERGFQVLDFCSQMRRWDGALWQTDLLFVRRSSRFIPEAWLPAPNRPPARRDPTSTLRSSQVMPNGS